MENEQNRTFFDGWKIVRKIDSGASGTVYEIRKTNHDIVMTSAMKVIQIPKDPSVASALSSDGLDEVSITGYFQGIVDELVDEIRLMISLKGFPQIVSCEDYEVQKAPDALSWTILIRMELLTSLQQYLEEKRLTEADICRMGTDLAQALALLEDKAIIHRDIKPANIFLSAYGTCKLGDFGIARVYDKAAGNLSKKGTINYMAPEVYRGMSYDQTVDIYSLGLVLYKLSNQNRLPFYPPGDSYTAMDEQQALMDRMNGEKELPLPVSVSAEFGEIIRKMCAFRAEERYRNAVELLEDLGRLQPTGQVVLTQKKPETEAFEEKASKTQDRELTDGLFKEKPRIQVTENSIEKEYPIPDLIPPEKKQEKEEKQNSL